MLHQKPRHSIINVSRFAAIAVSLVLVGCAQTQNEGYYNPPAEGTLNDAQRNAMGKRGSRAPSQLQIGFGQSEEEQKAARAQAIETHNDSSVVAVAIDSSASTANNRALAKPLIQAKTFLGTLPCTDSGNCQANRVTITFAPSGEWRARIQGLGNNQNSKPQLEQGCWNVTGQDPLRIAIQSLNNAITASFAFDNNNVMRLTNYNDARPKLGYSLTRQAEIDPIEDLKTTNPINCD